MILQSYKQQEMSIIIEMPQSIEQSQKESICRLLQTQISALIHHPQFNVAVIMAHTSHEIIIALPKGPLAFIRDTKWRLQILQSHLKLHVTFIDQSGLNYTRAQSERTKLQLIILLKLINNRLPIQQEYFVEPTTGILKYSFAISHKEYQQKLKGLESLRKLFRYVLTQLNTYAEIILLCEPIYAREGVACFSHPNLEKLNRYRFFLRNTRKFRENGLKYISNILQIKDQLRQSPFDPSLKMELEHVRNLFQNNIKTYEEMQIGLQYQNKQNIQKLNECIKHINKCVSGKSSPSSQSVEPKIVNGIMIIKQGDIKSVSKEGAHSQIMRGKFIYNICDTINQQVAKSNPIYTNGKQLRTELIFKKCNIQEQASINAFLNEIYLLDHLRDAKSRYIAKYYLKVKNFKDRNEHDLIYMQPYYHNLSTIIKKCKTLSAIQRLSMAYKISKGLCFLSYWSVLHRDFKPHNIMVDQNFNPVIIDFGSCAPIFKCTNFSVKQDRLLTTRLFHIYYHEIPPQYSYVQAKFSKDEYNRHPLFDVYSFGRVLCYIFFNTIIPPTPDEMQVYPYPELVRNILFLITICLQVDPDERPAFAEITSFLGCLEDYVIGMQKQMGSRCFSQPKRETTQMI